MFEISRPALLAMTLVCFALAQPARAQSTVPENPESMGQFLGARQTDHPDWFKESFLELEEDIAEATEQGKRLVVYFHQDGCPYCNKLVEENFTNPRILELMQDKFQLVAINMWGDREVVQVGGRAFSEKTLAAALDVDFTPTLLFFSEDRKVVLRLDGYYPPTEFIHALTYVSDKLETVIPSRITWLKSGKDMMPANCLRLTGWKHLRHYRMTRDQRPSWCCSRNRTALTATFCTT